MGNTFCIEEVEPMPWKGVTVSEQRQRFIEDYLLNYYSVTELAERFGISRNTAYRWINRYTQHGQAGYQELSQRPHTCPWQTDQAIATELVELRKASQQMKPRAGSQKSICLKWSNHLI